MIYPYVFLHNLNSAIIGCPKVVLSEDIIETKIAFVEDPEWRAGLNVIWDARNTECWNILNRQEEFIKLAFVTVQSFNQSLVITSSVSVIKTLNKLNKYFRELEVPLVEVYSSIEEIYRDTAKG